MSIATIVATVFNYIVIGIIIKCMFNLMDRSVVSLFRMLYSFINIDQG